MTTIEVGTGLKCGCCGCWFETWEGYEDQDQDIGFGICRSCQKSIEDRNKAEYDKIYRKIIEAVKPETAARMEAEVEKDPVMKTVYVNMALDKGFVTWGVTRTHEGAIRL